MGTQALGILHRLAGLAILLSLCASGIAAAQVGIRCDECSPTLAREAALIAGPGEFYVYGVPDGVVRGFSVEQEAGQMHARPIQVPADVRLAVSGLQELYFSSGGTMKSTFDVNAAGLDVRDAASIDAVDFLNDVVTRTMVLDALPRGDYSSSGITVAVRAAIQIALQRFGFDVGAEFLVTVRFSDGSSVKIVVRPGNPKGVYVVDSALTANGQIIPEANSAAYQGEWTGGFRDLETLLDQLNRLGAPVHYGTHNGPIHPSENIRVSCTFRDGTLTCVITIE